MLSARDICCHFKNATDNDVGLSGPVTSILLVLGIAVVLLTTAQAAAAQAANCGGLNQRACKIWERIPSCNRGLIEARGRCQRAAVPGRDCGRESQRPCRVTERIPSCNPGLYENFDRNRCQRLTPGQSPFLAGFGSATSQIAKTSKLCQSLLGRLPSISVPGSPVNTAIQCRRGYEIGYRCAAPKLFNLLTSNVQLTARFDAAMNSPACRRAPGPIKTICAVGQVVDQFAVRPALCMTSVVTSGGFTALAGGDSKTTELMCMVAGEFAFERAVRNALRQGSRGSSNKAELIRKLRKIKQVARKGRQLEQFFARLEREPACQGVLN